MKIFFIRLKNHPTYYVGKENPTCALSSDESIRNAIQHYHQNGKTKTAWDIISQDENNNPPYWFTAKERAKMWTTEKDVKRFVNRYNKGKTFSEYEVEIDDKESITIPLDTFMNNHA